MVKAFFLWLTFSVLARAETLTVATYNIQNYTLADRMTADGYRKAYPKPEAEKEALRLVIRAINADILALQEVGAAPYLEELRRDLRASGIDYPHAILLEGPDKDRHVALLAKRAPVTVNKHAELEFNYLGDREKVKRGLMEVTFATEAGDLTIFAVHLKSRFTDRIDDPQSSLRRTGEAVAVRDVILKRFPEPGRGLFMLVGDCNDAKASKPIRAFLARGKTEILALLPAADDRGDVWTHRYLAEDSYSRADYLFVSAMLRPNVVNGMAQIIDGEHVRAASDHRPVVVKLKLEKP